MTRFRRRRPGVRGSTRLRTSANGPPARSRFASGLGLCRTRRARSCRLRPARRSSKADTVKTGADGRLGDHPQGRHPCVARSGQRSPRVNRFVYAPAERADSGSSLVSFAGAMGVRVRPNRQARARLSIRLETPAGRHGRPRDPHWRFALRLHERGTIGCGHGRCIRGRGLTLSCGPKRIQPPSVPGQSVMALLPDPGTGTVGRAVVSNPSRHRGSVVGARVDKRSTAESAADACHRAERG